MLTSKRSHRWQKHELTLWLVWFCCISYWYGLKDSIKGGHKNKTKKTPLEMKDAKLACLVPTLQNNKYCIR